MDIYLFRIINNFAGSYPIFDRLVVYVTRYLIYTLPFLAALSFYFIFKTNRERLFELTKAVFAAFLAYALNFLISVIYFRLRPIFTLDDVHQLMTKPITDKSFPSDHTAVSFAIAFFVFWIGRKWGSAMLVLAFLIGISRIYVGVHYPSDVLVGALIGLVSAVIVRMSDKVK